MTKRILKQIKILNQLRKNKYIVFLKADNGNGIEISNKADYNKAILDVISDSNRSKEVANDPTIYREGKLCNSFYVILKIMTRLIRKSRVKFTQQFLNQKEFMAYLKCIKFNLLM